MGQMEPEAKPGEGTTGTTGTTGQDTEWMPGASAPASGTQEELRVTEGADTPGATRLGYRGPSGETGDAGNLAEELGGSGTTGKPTQAEQAAERAADVMVTSAPGGDEDEWVDTDMGPGPAAEQGSLGTRGGTDRSGVPGE